MPCGQRASSPNEEIKVKHDSIDLCEQVLNYSTPLQGLWIALNTIGLT